MPFLEDEDDEALFVLSIEDLASFFGFVKTHNIKKNIP